MLTLQDMLTQRTWRELRATAHTHGLPFNTHQTAAAARERLHVTLVREGTLRRSFAQLSGMEQDALRTLQAAGGRMTLQSFAGAFGFVRPYRPWQLGEPRHPWKKPRNTAEGLWYKGLITFDEEFAYTPVEVLRLLPPLPSVHPAPNAAEDKNVNTSPLQVDMALLLGVLLRQNIKPQWGRWLPPYAFKVVNQTLQAKDASTNTARSELQTGRIRLLHYMAEVSGLISVQGGWLKPTPSAWEWLDSTPEAQWQYLNESISRDLSNRESLWQRYRLPAVTVKVWCELLRLLESLERGQTFSLISLIAALRPYVPGETLAVLPELLEGPLNWLGTVTVYTDDSFRWNGLPSNLPAPQNASLEVKEDVITLHLPSPPRLRPLVELMAWVEVEESCVCVNAQTVRRALASHAHPTQLLALIEKLTGAPLPQSIWDQLEHWSRAAHRLVLEQRLLLTSPDAAILATLRSDRRLRLMFESALSAHHLAIAPHHAHELVKRLQQRGLPITNQRTEPDKRSALGNIDSDTATYLWVAVRAYQDMARFMELPLRIPGATSDWLAAHLPQNQRGLLERSAQALSEAVQRLGANEALASSPAPAQTNPAIIREKVEHAYRAHSALTIDYFSPALGTVTRRTIEPILPIVQRGDYAYVEAWCREAEAERTFRLDRMVRIIGIED